MKTNDKLKHLSTDEINTLMNLYYSGEKSATNLVAMYNIDSPPTHLYKLFPAMKLEDVVCENCNEPMYQKRPSKSSYGKNLEKPYCESCGHTDSYRCKCKACDDKRQQMLRDIAQEKVAAEKRDRELIEKTYALRGDFKDYDSLTFTDKVYLGALCRYALGEDGNSIKPTSDLGGMLAPYDMYFDIIKELYRKEIILVHPNSPTECFVRNEVFPNTFRIDMVTYFVNIKYASNKQDTVDKILNPDLRSIDCIEEAYDIWRRIALTECIDYLLLQMNRVGFKFEPGEKTVSVMNTLLDNFSVSQIYAIIYNSITKATRYYQEQSVSKNQAANSVITRCEAYGERILMNGWSINRYDRIKELPQSALSEYLFNKVLKIGDSCFNQAPSIDYLKGSMYDIDQDIVLPKFND